MFAALSGAGVTGAGVLPLPVPPHPQKRRRNNTGRERPSHCIVRIEKISRSIVSSFHRSIVTGAITEHGVSRRMKSDCPEVADLQICF